MEHSNEKQKARLALNNIDNKNSDDKDKSNTQPPNKILFFVKVGINLPQKRIDILAKRAQGFGAIILSEFPAPDDELAKRKKKKKKNRRRLWENQQQSHNGDTTSATSNTNQSDNDDKSTTDPHRVLLTHLVMGEDCQAERVAKALKFPTVELLKNYLLEVRFSFHHVPIYSLIFV